MMIAPGTAGRVLQLQRARSTQLRAWNSLSARPVTRPSPRRRSSAAPAAEAGTFTTTTTATEPSAAMHASKQPAAASDNAKTGDVSGAMLEPSVANTSWARSLAMVAAVGLAAAGTGFLPSRAIAFVHVLAFGTWLGTNVWNTFFVGLTMFRVVPRQTFGRIQSHLFPKYFALTTAANILLLGTALIGPLAARATSMVVPSLGVALATSLINWLVIEPIATKLMFQRYDLENLPEKTDDTKAKIQALYKEFGKFHGISSLINLVILCCAFSHAWFLGTLLTV